MKPGDQLRKLRDRLAITTRDVEEFSRLIAEDRLNEEFYISNAWLTQLENTNSIPSIYKLYSLSVVYRTRFSDLLKVFGIDLNDTPRYQLALPLAQTHLVSFEEPGPAQAVTFPVRFEKGFSPATTSLISRIVEVWGEVPVAVLQRLDVRRSQYGYIGTDDFAMYPLLRPGSCRSKVARPDRKLPNGERTSTGRFTSSTRGRDTRVRGARCAGRS